MEKSNESYKETDWLLLDEPRGMYVTDAGFTTIWANAKMFSSRTEAIKASAHCDQVALSVSAVRRFHYMR